MATGVGRALVVDADDDFRAVVASRLADEGYAVTEVSEVRAAIGAMDAAPTDVAIVDVDLPDMAGVDVVRAVRRATDASLIAVSARAAETDRIAALDAGADDHMVKPISVAELMARVRAVTRRARPSPAEGGLRFGDLLIDRRSREVRIGDDRVALTHREFDLLAYLASSPGQVFSREQLLDQVWGSSSEWQDSKTVTEHVRRLRLKLDGISEGDGWIRTVHGVGYAFTGGTNTA